MAPQTKNRILLSLPSELRGHVIERCSPVHLELGRVLSRAGQPLPVVHFPETAVVSTVSTFADGSAIEVANIGRDGCTGTSLVLRNPRELTTNIVQLAGQALAMDAKDFTHLKVTMTGFERALFGAVQGVFFQVMVSSACNATHSARERLARWLLTMRDRSDSDVMYLTHDFLAEILGVRRATVSEAAGAMKDKGLIDYSRGRITIVDRAGLRKASCECYDLVRDAYASLLPHARDR